MERQKGRTVKQGLGGVKGFKEMRGRKVKIPAPLAGESEISSFTLKSCETETAWWIRGWSFSNLIRDFDFWALGVEIGR
ncbi:hypothetical protein Nepgr_019726 [Nepenthes gracilis]|uniref:Uncharacterized protein n=1 Tax=Nepenthes gracilis TaxID=150966 RepID=A0AAD3SU15_NEPGR|nr:hypothetical protein Nepgr_019726 [Nepenthes gracilis]